MIKAGRIENRKQREGEREEEKEITAILFSKSQFSCSPHRAWTHFWRQAPSSLLMLQYHSFGLRLISIADKYRYMIFWKLWYSKAAGENNRGSVTAAQWSWAVWNQSELTLRIDRKRFSQWQEEETGKREGEIWKEDKKDYRSGWCWILTQHYGWGHVGFYHGSWFKTNTHKNLIVVSFQYQDNCKSE